MLVFQREDKPMPRSNRKVANAATKIPQRQHSNRRVSDITAPMQARNIDNLHATRRVRDQLKSSTKALEPSNLVPQRHHLDRRASDLIATAPGLSGDFLLTTRETADWLKVSVVWLEIGRSHGYGPKFMRLSPRRIRYRRDDVLRFLEERTHARTSEYADRAEA